MCSMATVDEIDPKYADPASKADGLTLSQEDLKAIGMHIQVHVRSSEQAIESMAVAVDSMNETVSKSMTEAVDSMERTISKSMTEAIGSMERTVSNSMSEAAASMKQTVSDAVSESSGHSGGTLANAGLTVAILSLFAVGAFWTLDTRLSSYEKMQEQRLAAYEKSAMTIAEDLKKLRQENIDQTNVFYNRIGSVTDRIDAVNARVGGAHDRMIDRIEPAGP